MAKPTIKATSSGLNKDPLITRMPAPQALTTDLPRRPVRAASPPGPSSDRDDDLDPETDRHLSPLARRVFYPAQPDGLHNFRMSQI
jgi:hypothetical protein